MSQNRLIDPNIKKDDALDRAIRPTSLSDYIGQPKVREQMEVFIGAAKKRREALDHTLILAHPVLARPHLPTSSLVRWGVIYAPRQALCWSEQGIWRRCSPT